MYVWMYVCMHVCIYRERVSVCEREIARTHTHTHRHTHTHTHTHTHIHTRKHTFVCVHIPAGRERAMPSRKCSRAQKGKRIASNKARALQEALHMYIYTHTHTHKYMYMYVYMYIYGLRYSKCCSMALHLKDGSFFVYFPSRAHADTQTRRHTNTHIFI